MQELVVLSGKGGAGKTSLTASLAALAPNAVLADCDVDAADLHIVLDPKRLRRSAFRSGRLAVVDQRRCTECGACVELCRFDAPMHPEGKGRTPYRIDAAACEGCGVCVRFCPAGAIAFPERLCGEWFESETRFGPLVDARLDPGAENSGKLVSLVRRRAREIAEENAAEWLLVDGPPGIGCPVIASLTGADLLLVTTEPSPSGEHDVLRVLELAAHFKIPAMLCVNRWDVNPERTEAVEAQARAAGARIVGRIPWDAAVTDAQVQGRSVVEHGDGPASRSIRKVWENVCRIASEYANAPSPQTSVR